ncbi:MAG: universal stress protein [Syntrophomonas sp.]
MYKRALVAVDGSEQSLKAVQVAKEMFEKGALEDLSLIYVVGYPQPIISGHGLNTVYQDLQKDLLSEAKQIMDKTLVILGDTIKAKCITEIGLAAETIIKTAEKDQCDLIIIGNRGLNQIQRFILGSVSTKVISQAHCSVLVVK